MCKRLVISFLLPLLIVTCPTTAATTSLPTTTYQLTNGLNVIVREDHRAPVATVQVWYRVGSMDEPEGLTGISHMLEHMMFKGTHAHPNGSFAKIMAANGGDFNAFTNEDCTAYYETLANNRIAISFELESDRMQHARFTNEDFTKEMEVVKEERRIAEDKPEYLTYERFAASAFVANPYSHPTLGWMHDLDRMTVNDVRTWYRNWYAPNNATLVVVGDVQPQIIYKLAKRYFGNLHQKTLPERKRLMSILEIGQRHVKVKAKAQVPVILRGYNVPALYKTEDWEPYALKLLAYVLGGSDSARLQTNLIRKQQIAAASSTHYDPLQRAPTVFLLQGIPAPSHTTEELAQAFDEEIQALKTKRISDEELARAKTRFLAKNVFAKDSLYYQAYEIGNFTNIGLNWQDADTFLAHIQKITAAQLQQVAKRYLNPNRRTDAVLVPQPIHEEQGAQHA